MKEGFRYKDFCCCFWYKLVVFAANCFLSACPLASAYLFGSCNGMQRRALEGLLFAVCKFKWCGSSNFSSSLFNWTLFYLSAKQWQRVYFLITFSLFFSCSFYSFSLFCHMYYALRIEFFVWASAIL